MSNAAIELLAKDLNHQGGVFCPSPKADMKIWNTHPKVYLDVARTGEAKCPYCGTVYKLKAGALVQAAFRLRPPRGGVAHHRARKWIGDAVMTEPLLRRLACARRAAHRWRLALGGAGVPRHAASGRGH
jgi:uncharacterized Zn-finger protein